MQILNLTDDNRSGCISVLTVMKLNEYKKMAFHIFYRHSQRKAKQPVIFL